ncbi:MAG: hypothetical protein AAGF44_11465 [Pseudomonadota bacterium]
MSVIVLRLILLFAVLSVIYIGLSAFDRWQVRERLRSEHATGQGGKLTEEDYVHKGLANYERSWRRKLLYGVFLLPFLTMLILIYVANYQ